MRFVALLRGVNVGGKNRVPMGELRSLMEELGLTGVRTLLNSGNAVFVSGRRSARTHAEAIRKALNEKLGVDVRVIVKTAGEVGAAIDENPIRKSDAAKLLVCFTQDPADLRPLKAIEALLAPGEVLHVGRHAAYFYLGAGVRESKAAAALLGRAGQAATTRNWATVQKLGAMLSRSGSANDE